MKIPAVVIDVSDPKKLGRIRVKFTDSPNDNKSPWVWPCSFFAGAGYGMFCLPEIGDKVWIEKSYNDKWVVAGYFWTEGKPKPTDGDTDVRTMTTRAGHQIKLDDNGDLEIKHKSGSRCVFKLSGDIEITAAGNILLNGSDGEVVTTNHICAYTGSNHVKGTNKVKAGG